MPGAVEVHLGANAVIDPGVLLGYPSGRPGVTADTRIGPSARIRAGSIIYAGGRDRRGLRDRAPRDHP